MSCQAQVVATFSDQGANAIRIITGHRTPKGVTLVAVGVCNNSAASVTVSAVRVYAAIAIRSRQKPQLEDPVAVGLILASYSLSTPAARLTALAKQTTTSAAILTAAKVISAGTGWTVGLQLGANLIDTIVPTLPPASSLINVGQNILQGDLVLPPGGCKSGLAVARTAQPGLLSEEVPVQ